ncbi:hypothetical protein P171DRAFT_429657 [Karstenula rhodostoma CBS 690.94]|uniref:Uncharacterized protein n=1 Tax=Karstenula rhodostoma CBS 690.94 TaxID=1392251 RepID=A0A9P4PNV7_9PLEO|nr:hypothetical protein P171DRAFT_429657 [Karstenula rhodostoma CBS 690.94]
MVEVGEPGSQSEARGQFADGVDGILKGFLIAYCPRLRNITFVKTDRNGCSTLEWL